MSHGAANHHYVLDAGVALTGQSDPTILDYGCGAGGVVKLGRARGLKVFGADTFDGRYADYLNQLPPELAGTIVSISNQLPFPEAHFDLVIANQVFEHVADLQMVLKDIARVLKPNGILLSLFPLSDTWYEGHVGLYFAHWLQARPAAQRRYLAMSHRCGFGLDRVPGQSAQAWSEAGTRAMQSDCYYRTGRHARQLLKEAIGTTPRDLSASYIAYRLRHARLQKLARLESLPLGRTAFTALAHVRAGVVLATTKSAAGAA